MDGQDGQDKKGAGEPTALIRGHTQAKLTMHPPDVPVYDPTQAQRARFRIM